MRNDRSPLLVWVLIFVGFLLYLLIRYGVGVYTNYLWFQHLNLETVFLTSWSARFGVGVGVAILFTLIFLVNTLIARRLSIHNVLFFSEEVLVAQKFVGWIILGVTLFLAWAIGSLAATDWLRFLKFFNQHSFGLADPIFNLDISFYVFTLPIYQFVQGWLIGVLILSLLGTLGIYALAQQDNLAEGRLVVLPHVQLHLSILGALIFLAFAFGHWLSLFDLMYSPRGVAIGPSYTDINVSMPALWTMTIVAIITAAILLVNTLIRRPTLSLVAVGVWLLVSLVGNGLLPELIQRYVVEPNELARETPYIENNIKFTNLAYGLDKITERSFSDVAPLTRQDVIDHDLTLQNVRLWDYRPLQQTYQQLQAIRLYYQFKEVDLDRYEIDGQLRQVALAARELDKNQLQSQTWVNQRLQFTHGYGVVVNPVNLITPEGLPELWVKDLPPQSSVELAVERPEIYYGEADSDYVFVNTTEREFNYPSGDQNVFTNYEGSGGVVLDTYLKRLVFAVRQADINMLLSQEFTNQSRIMLYRNIQERAQKVAPFLAYDEDPYLVIGPDGHLYWMQDAYTTSDLFPYSERIRARFGEINYIRNSVKVVIDAYNGDLTFYVVDPTDPLVQTYMAIFPALFTPLAQMPDWQRAHLRYPEDMFSIQAHLYQTYHMRDVNVFYNKEDLWEVPQEAFAGETVPVEPYYVILKLPGEEAADEFVLIQPFTPNNKDNLVAWLAARSDGENYGQLVVYNFPKQELVFGPLQIEGRIDQNPEISSQITLWDQGGSQVIRGNLLVLPIGNSLLYVEPLYLQAENGQIPELKRVVLASGDRIVMEETLAEAVEALFSGEPLTAPVVAAEPGEPAAPAESSPPAPAQPLSEDIGVLAQTASDHYDAAQEALRQGDWQTYGEELDKMKAALEQLVRLTNPGE